LDERDRDLLEMIASGPMRQLELARRVGVASLTVKRRIEGLIDAGMVTAKDRCFRISGAGVTAPAMWPNDRRAIRSMTAGPPSVHATALKRD
jgi:DNA-binding Lrp family transcriptional regulator